MNTKSRRKAIVAGLWCIAGLSAAPFQALAHDPQGPQGHGHGTGAQAGSGDLGTAAAFDKDGRLWAVLKETNNGDQYVIVQSSADMGKTWTAPRRIQKKPEPVAASGEARPHIAFGPKGEIYVSYTSTVARPHIGNIRFARSLDGGKSFSEPVTAHANKDFVTHSFESLVVDGQGRVYVAWIDGRDAAQAKQRKERYTGSAVYYAVSSDRGATFKGDYKVADHSCECCRIGLSLNSQGNVVALWRHVFAPNIRDHAFAELKPDGNVSAVSRATFDDWRADACPHHGPSIAYTADGARHQVWFNGREDTGGAFYVVASPQGKLAAPVAIGGNHATHPDVAAQGKQVAVAWKEFDGKATAIVARLSDDGGKTWTQREVARTTANSDKPYLIHSPSGIVLIWRTQSEGIHVIPLAKGKA